MNVSFFVQSDGDKGISQTLIQMRDAILASDKTRVIKTKARELITGIAPNDEVGQVTAVFTWVRDNIPYVRDIYGVEEITQPDRLLESFMSKKNDYSSDCDDKAMLVSALLRSIGFRTRVEALAINQPTGYDHARAAVFMQSKGVWWPLETTKPGISAGVGLQSQRPILGLEVV